MYSKLSLVALAALSIGQTIAGPTHAHLHRKKDLTKKDNADLANVDWESIPWAELKVDWNNVNYNGGSSSSAGSAASATSVAQPTTTVAATTVAPAVSAAPTTTTASASASSSKSASSSASSSGSSGSSQMTGLFENLFNGIVGVSNSRSAFGSQVATSGNEVSYISNYGNPYGSNVILVPEVGNQLYTATFINTSPDEITVNLWNKPGMNGQANSGCTDAPKQTTLTFNLSPQQQAIVAFAENSVVAATYASDNIAPSGAFASVWVEMKFADHDCGYDVSKILNTGPDYEVSMSSAECGCVSSNTENNWITETQTTGSGSCYVNVGGLHLTIKLGGPIS